MDYDIGKWNADHTPHRLSPIVGDGSRTPNKLRYVLLAVAVGENVPGECDLVVESASSLCS